MGTPVHNAFNQVLPPCHLSWTAISSFADNQSRLFPTTHSYAIHPGMRLLSYCCQSCSPSSPISSRRRSISLKSSFSRRGRLVIACYTSPASNRSPHSEVPQSYLSSEKTLLARTSPGAIEETSETGVLGSSSSSEEQSYFGDGLAGVPDVGDSLTMESPEEEDHSGSLDPELQGILANIADMRRQNEMLGERMRDIHELVGKTTRSLNAKAQDAKIEAAKLRKLAKSHQIEEIRRAEEVRRKVIEARLQMGRNGKIFGRVLKSDRKTDMSPNGPITLKPGGHYSDIAGADGTTDQAPSTLTSIGLPTPGEDLASTSSELSTLPEHVSEEGSLKVKAKVEDMGPNTVGFQSQECIVAHPGAVSCTKTVIRTDPVTKAVVVSLETTVRRDEDIPMVSSLDEDDYVALAVQTLVDTAEELKKSRFEGMRAADPGRLKKHSAILDLLENGRVVKATPMDPPSKFGHESFIVKLRNSQTGEKIDTLFKPGIKGNADGWHRAPIEMVAYKLNLMLGMDLVPPVVYRSGGVDVNYRHYEDGAFIYFVPSTKLLRKVPATSWGVSVAVLLSDTRILDVLLNNSDRHHGNFLFGEHWADGKLMPILIDHAAGFREEALVKMEHENAFQTGPVKCVSAKTYLRLRFLDKQNVASTFNSILSDAEVEGLMERRNMILSYLDNLVQERGYHRVVIET